MDLIGLTGGIGTGKSTVSAMLRDLGVTVVDADEAARAIVEPGQPALHEIAKEFGPDVIRDGRLDRAALAERVFGDAGSRRRLEAITHPRIREWMGARIGESAERGEPRIVLDIPLLFEARNPGDFAAIIVVAAPEEEQVRRLVARGMDEADARARIAAQLSVAAKVKRATHVIDNSGTREQTRDQLLRVWRQISGV